MHNFKENSVKVDREALSIYFYIISKVKQATGVIIYNKRMFN